MSKIAKKPDSEETCPNCGGEMEDGACKDTACGYKASKEDGCMQHGKEEMDSKVCDACGKKDGCTKMPKVKTDGTSRRVDRVDYWGPLNQISERTEPMKALASGALKGKAAFTCVGVFRYLAEDGTIRNEFRPPEEVFKKESLESWELAALTNTHPKEKVTPLTYKGVAVGSLGEEIENDAYNVYAEVTIQDADAIAAVQAGRTGLSGGYSCDMVSEGTVSYPVMGWAEDPADGKWKEMETGRTVYKVPGNWGGIPYDEIQTNIIGNHVALVDVPRGGDALHLRFDSADPEVGIRVPPTEAPVTKADGTTPQLRTGGETMKKIRLDGAVEHEVPEAVAIHIDALDAKVKTLESDKSTLQAKADSAAEALEAEKKARADEAAGFQVKLDSAVQSRIALVSLATKHGVKADGTDAEIRTALILKAFPAAKLDGKDAAYLDARYDGALEILEVEDTKREDGVPASQRQSVADGAPVPSEKTDGSDWGAYQAEQRSKNS